MTVVTIDFEVNDRGGISVINQTTGALTQMESAATKAGGSGGAGGLGGLVQGAADAYGAFQILSGSLSQGLGMISSVNALGEASRKAAIGLDIMSKGAGSDFLAAGRTATRGLIDDMALSQAATDGLARGLFKTSDEFKRIAGDGAAMGTVLGTDAVGGVNALEAALEKTGSKRAAMSLGLDADAIMVKFKELKQSGEDATTAWRDAVLGAADAMSAKLGPSIDNGPGAAMTRLSTKWDNFKAAFSERVSIGLDGIAGLVELMDNPTFTAFINGKTKQLEGVPSGSTGPSSNAGLGLNAGNGQNLNDVVSSGIAAGFETLATDPAALAAFLGNSKTNNGTAYGVLNDVPLGYNPDMSSGDYAKLKYSTDGGRGHGGGVSAYELAQYENNTNALPQTPRAAVNDQQDDSTLINTRRQRAQDDSGYTYQQSLAASQDEVKAILAARDAYREKTAAVKADGDEAQSDMMLINARADAERHATQAAIDHRNAIQSVDQAFGIQKDGLYGQVGATGAQGSAQARNDLIAQDKRFGTARTNSDLAKFDAADKKGADDYALATGAATKESLAFRDAEAAAADGLAKHRIGVTEYWKEMKLLADAAKDGKTSLKDISDIGAGAVMNPAFIHLVGGTGGPTDPAGTRPGMNAKGGLKSIIGGDGPNADDPMAPITTSSGKATIAADAVKTSITAIGTTLGMLAGNAPGWGQSVATAVAIPQANAEKLAAQLKLISDLVHNVNGTFTFTSMFTYGGTGGGSSGSPSNRASISG